jgi:antitoxin HigA-1
LRLARYFGFSPEYWLNMQAHYDLEIIRRQSLAKIEREVNPREAA